MPALSLFEPSVARRAARELSRRDRALAEVIKGVGPLRLPPRLAGGAFAFLVRAVVFQQLAAPAASAIHGRVRRALGDGRGAVAPAALRRAGAPGLAACGVSAPKARTLLGLAAAVEDGSLQPGALWRLDDDAVRERLCRLHGIGPWTAEIFLMFHLGRPDVWPATDLGIRYAVAALHGDQAPWPPRRVAEHGEAWRPWRSAAAWWLWNRRSGQPPDFE